MIYSIYGIRLFYTTFVRAIWKRSRFEPANPPLLVHYLLLRPCVWVNVQYFLYLIELSKGIKNNKKVKKIRAIRWLDE